VSDRIIPDADELIGVLRRTASPSPRSIRGVLRRVMSGDLLGVEDAGILLNAPAKYRPEIIAAAELVNHRLHGKEITFYGVCYLSDFCVNTCRYCGDNIYSRRRAWQSVIENGNLGPSLVRHKRILTKSQFVKDVKSLLAKLPDDSPLQEICMLAGETPSLTVRRLLGYLELLGSVFPNKIILNVPPLSLDEFAEVRNTLPKHRLHFRVFQETYDPKIFQREHPVYEWKKLRSDKLKKLLESKYGGSPPKRDFVYRLEAQSRALEAGFDEVGLGVLLGLNDGEFGSRFEILALKMHYEYLFEKFGVPLVSISFPRVLKSKGIRYTVPREVDEDELLHLVSVARLVIPKAKLIITCRERARFRRSIRSIINIEDYEARPGPGGNLANNGILFQMEIRDRRTGEKIRREMVRDGYAVK